MGRPTGGRAAVEPVRLPLPLVQARRRHHRSRSVWSASTLPNTRSPRANLAAQAYLATVPPGICDHPTRSLTSPQTWSRPVGRPRGVPQLVETISDASEPVILRRREHGRWPSAASFAVARLRSRVRLFSRAAFSRMRLFSWQTAASVAGQVHISSFVAELALEQLLAPPIPSPALESKRAGSGRTDPSRWVAGCLRVVAD